MDNQDKLFDFLREQIYRMSENQDISISIFLHNGGAISANIEPYKPDYSLD